MPCAHAAHPLQTEDTATQGEHVLEVESGLAWSRRDTTTGFLYQPQLSLGLTPSLDAIMQPSWVREQAAGVGAIRGFGDTNVDVKWRFAEAKPWSLATRSGLTLATNQNGLGLPKGRAGAHVLLAATWTEATLAAHVNLGVLYMPGGADQRDVSGHVSSALAWRPSSDWSVLTEATTDTSTERGSRAWPASVLIAAVRTLTQGTDVDVGFRLTFDRGTTTRTVLVGFTTHFSR